MQTAKLRPRYQNSCALVIGINKYQQVNPLSHACSDAESVAEILTSDLNFPKGSVTVLLDDQATRAGIMKAFLAFESLSSDDRVLVFFAGHGETVTGQRGDVGYLVPVDGQTKDKSTLIPWYELTQGAEIIPAKHILFVMDACYSGLALQRGGKAGGQRFISDMLQRVSRQVITAGKADQPVADGGSATGRNSIFTGHLLEGLRGKAANDNGVLTATHLMHYVYDKVAVDPHSHQTPHYGHLHGDGDFILRMPENIHLSEDLGEDFLVETLPDRPEPPSVSTQAEIKPVFAERNGYLNPEDEKFGKNEWTAKLGEFRSMGAYRQKVRASHWLALVVEPVSNQLVDFDLANLAKTLKSASPTSDKPFEQFHMPSQAITTAKSVIFYDREIQQEDGKRDEIWRRFVRIESNGAIEYCDLRGAAGVMYAGRTPENRGTPINVFSYIQVIGRVWNFLFAAKRLLRLANYESGVRLLVNLVGAKDSLLVEFSKQLGADQKSWLDPFDFDAAMNGSLENWRCRDLHFQSEFLVGLSSLGEPESKKLIVECAKKLGLAYNHQSSPRCFNHGTDLFPWQMYDPNRHLQ